MKYTKFGQTLQQNMWIPSFCNLFLGAWRCPFQYWKMPKKYDSKLGGSKYWIFSQSSHRDIPCMCPSTRQIGSFDGIDISHGPMIGPTSQGLFSKDGFYIPKKSLYFFLSSLNIIRRLFAEFSCVFV